MSTTTAARAPERPGPLDRLLGLFSEVRPGEGARALLMLVNVFLILVSYYVIKTVREPLILGTGVPASSRRSGSKSAAEVKTFAAAGQALVLMAFVPAYSWFASRVDRMNLIVGVTLFFSANILAFAVAVHAGVPFVGVAFYVWVGFFSLSIIAQFWSIHERHLHEGRGQPAVPHHRDRRDGRQPGRGLGRRASLRRPREPLT